PLRDEKNRCTAATHRRCQESQVHSWHSSIATNQAAPALSALASRRSGRAYSYPCHLISLLTATGPIAPFPNGGLLIPLPGSRPIPPFPDGHPSRLRRFPTVRGVVVQSGSLVVSRFIGAAGRPHDDL